MYAIRSYYAPGVVERAGEHAGVEPGPALELGEVAGFGDRQRLQRVGIGFARFADHRAEGGSYNFV